MRQLSPKCVRESVENHWIDLVESRETASRWDGLDLARPRPSGDIKARAGINDAAFGTWSENVVNILRKRFV